MRPLLIALVELKIYVRDARALAFSLVLPIALLLVMWGAFSGSGHFHGTATVVDLDHSPESAQLIAALRSVNGLSVELVSEAKANGWLDQSAREMVTVIPKGFGQAIRSGDGTAQIQFRERGGGGQEGQVVSSIVRAVTDQMAERAMVTRQTTQVMGSNGPSQSAIQSAVSQVLQSQQANPAVSVLTHTVGTTTSTLDIFFPGLITMITMLAITIRSQVLVEERQSGTLERLLLSRASPYGIFAGKFLSNTVRAFTQVIVLVTLGYFLLGTFGIGTYLQLLLFGLVLSISVASVGMALAAVVRTREQATWTGATVTLVMAVAGGSFIAIPSSGFFHFISYLTLNRYGNQALQAIVEHGDTVAQHGFEVAVLLGVAVVLTLVSAPLFEFVEHRAR